jgi:hypothetical protein
MLAAAAANFMASAVERPSSTPTMYAAVKQSPAPAGHTFSHAIVKQSETWRGMLLLLHGSSNSSTLGGNSLKLI